MFKRWLERRKELRKMRKARGAVYSIMKTNPAKAETICGYVQCFDFSLWEHGKIKVERSRFIRADLIIVYTDNREEPIAEWVDQSHAYKGLMGINDMHWNSELFTKENISGKGLNL